MGSLGFVCLGFFLRILMFFWASGKSQIKAKGKGLCGPTSYFSGGQGASELRHSSPKYKSRWQVVSTGKGPPSSP